jgi:high-affinity iron transporter
MVESFVIVLREGIEAALVVAIVVGALRKSGREDLYPRVTQGLGLAALFSIAAGVLLHRLAVDEELLEGIVMLVAAVFVGSMMWWVHRASRRMREHVGARVAAAVGRGGWAIFWLTFVLVAREGIEAVLFVSAASLNSDTLATLAGGSLGLAVAVAFGVAFAKGSLRIDLRRFFQVTNFVLGILLLQLLIGGLHELGEAGILPVGRREMAIIGPVVKNNVLFILAILLIPIFALATAGKSAPVEGSGPEARLARAKEIRERRGLQIAAALSAVILAILATSFVRNEAARHAGPATAVAISGGEVKIPLARVSDGHLHRFESPAGGKATRFLVIRAAGEIRTTFDACQICGTVGYNEVGGNVVCLYCDAAINSPTIGKSGGCNPLPLPSRIEGSDVVILEKDLAAQSSQFPAAPAAR